MSKTGYPFEVPIEVTFRDVDAMGHVNNAVFFTFMETARIKYVVNFFDKQAIELLELDLPLILVHASCDYKSPALFGETITVGLGISRFGTKSFDLAYKLVGENGRLIARGHTVQVMYDYTKRSAFPVTAAVKERVAAFQGDWQPDEA